MLRALPKKGNIPAMVDLSNAPFVFLDIETTGLSPWFGDRICQIALIQTEGRRVKQTFDILLNPERILSPAAAHINGLDEDKLARAPQFEKIAPQLEPLLTGSILVCHNARFDMQFFDAEFRKIGREPQFPNLIDTLILSRMYFELPSYSLQYLANAFHVSLNTQGSRAQADALTAKNIFFAMMDAMKPMNKPLEDFIGIYNSPAWPQEGIELPIELGEAIYSGKKLFISYMDREGEISERWISDIKVIGLQDYIYLQAYCHTRNAERSFRLDRILSAEVE